LRVSRLLALLAALLLAAGAGAQQELPANGLLLVAKPGLEDSNFGRSVVLVTQTPDFHTVGVILNRRTRDEHRGQPLWFGGPVMPSAIVALLQSDSPPAAPAFHVHKRVYLTMHPANITALLQDPGQRYRLYAGFSGWAPGQLLNEFARAGWHVLAPDEEILFRKDTSGLWEELLARASGERAKFTRDRLSYNP